MPTFTVHAPPQQSGRSTDPERFVFVRDGFYFWAFVLAPLWLLLRRLWLVLVGYIVLNGVIEVAFYLIGAPRPVSFLVGLLIALLVGFEAATLRRWTLDRRGWSMLGFTVGDDLESAEQRFFSSWVGQKEEPAPPAIFAAPIWRGAAVTFGCHWPVSRAGGKTMSVAIVDYGSGNLHSAAKAFERASRDSGSGQAIVVTSDPAAVARADRVVLPGVGAFADCRRGLDDIPGMVEALNESVLQRGRPFFGICVGMQLMAERGREYQVTPGLGWIAGDVDRIAPSDPALKIPHMGWNTLTMLTPHPLLAEIPARAGRFARLFRALL